MSVYQKSFFSDTIIEIFGCRVLSLYLKKEMWERVDPMSRLFLTVFMTTVLEYWGRDTSCFASRLPFLSLYSK
jgi:hypothetical protein